MLVLSCFGFFFRTSAAIDKNKQLLAARRKSRGPRPPNREAVIEWFHQEEKSKKTVQDPSTGKISEWFHGRSLFEPHHEKTCLWDLIPGKTQTGLLSYLR